MTPATAAATKKKKEYINTTQGHVGAITIDRKGDEKAIGIEPGGRVFLNDEERDLTARSHRKPTDSPFEPQHIVYRDEFTGEVTFEADLCPLEDATSFQRSGGKLPGSP